LKYSLLLKGIRLQDADGPSEPPIEEERVDVFTICVPAVVPSDVYNMAVKKSIPYITLKKYSCPLKTTSSGKPPTKPDPMLSFSSCVPSVVPSVFQSANWLALPGVFDAKK
jgi:hypothetical protein